MNKPTAWQIGKSTQTGCGGTDNYPPDPTCLWELFAEAYWFNEGCYIGCDKCDGVPHTPGTPPAPKCVEGMEATLPAEYRTTPDAENPTLGTTQDVVPYTPWRAPGFAPVENSCGIGGGWNFSDPAMYLHANGGSPPLGDGGRLGTSLISAPVDVWKVGGTARVSWRLHANHGGGYQYRLCPINNPLDEICFQKTPLKFSSPESWLVYPLGDRKNFTATRVSTGVRPTGYDWTRNPIPACAGVQGGGDHGCTNNDGGGYPAYEPVVANAWGFGHAWCIHYDEAIAADINACNRTEWKKVKVRNDISIEDEIVVPNVAPGLYVLSWRWDCEQSAQVWTSCSTIQIENA